MEDKELARVIDFIEGYYSRKLDSNEIKAIKFELKDFNFEKFHKELSFPLLKKVEYFTVAQLHKIIEEYKDLQAMKSDLGINSFEELYEN